MTLYNFKGCSPKIAEGCFIAPSAQIIGNVELGRGSSVWFNTVLRGDVHYIKIGENTNIQDNSTLHVTHDHFPLNIGDGVTIGHRALVHGCTLGDRVLVGMGAIVLDGAEVGSDSIVAAGTLVPEGARFPPHSVLMGIPARLVRETTERDMARIKGSYESYAETCAEYLSAPMEVAIDTKPGSV
jgi:carbonic anhydrase/acetyltransferase-like protein (isoleucine patch superfamily)